MLIIGENGVNLLKRKDVADEVVKSILTPFESKGRQKELPKLENLIIILEPNAARFEFHAVDNRILAGFLHHGYNVLLFNYLGYDGDTTQQYLLEVI